MAPLLAIIDHAQLGDQAVVLDGRELREGERVIAGINDRRSGVRNGTAGTLQRIDHDAQTLHVRTDRGADLQIPFDYAAGRTREGRPHLDYAYAVTVHRAQGDTWGAAHYLGGEDTYRQEAYTALSRARHTLRFYATTPDLDTNVPHLQQLTELDPLARALGRGNAKALAREALDRARRRPTLRPRPSRSSADSRFTSAAIDQLHLAHRDHLARVTAPSPIRPRTSPPPSAARRPIPPGHTIWSRAASLIEHHRREHAPDLSPLTPGLGPRPSRAADYPR
jgi:hypothetical protein